VKIVQEWNAKELIAEISGHVASGMDSACQFVVAQAKGRAPKRTGKLARNIDYEVDAHGLVITGLVGGRKGKGSAFYEIWVEMGTKAQPAQPHLRPAVLENGDEIVRLIAKG
jgi:HK97 gp10 family phage protein